MKSKRMKEIFVEYSSNRLMWLDKQKKNNMKAIYLTVRSLTRLTYLPACFRREFFSSLFSTSLCCEKKLNKKKIYSLELRSEKKSNNEKSWKGRKNKQKILNKAKQAVVCWWAEAHNKRNKRKEKPTNEAIIFLSFHSFSLITCDLFDGTANVLSLKLLLSNFNFSWFIFIL